MIIEWLLDALQAVIEFMLGLLPEDDTNFTGSLDTVLGSLGGINYFLPIAEVIAVVIGIFALFPVLLGVTVTLWIYAQLRGSSASA